MKYDEILDIDDTDKEIIRILQDEPELTHQEIADKIHKSQPAVGARVIKLKRKKLLSEMIGAEFDKIDVKLARVDIMAKNVEELWERLRDCPYISNCFKMTGEYNIMIEIIAPTVKTIDHFVDVCLRKDPNILGVRTNFIIDSVRRYVIPLSFDIEKYDEANCNVDCGGKMTKSQLNELLQAKD
jgi:DNA-binding Lrp family transcriptional regulator